MSDVVPFSLKDAPALIEKLLPVQKLSAEAYKEQMAGAGKTLTALGSYWKGRKPLILNKACILGCLLPATADSGRDLEIFEMLMAMDGESLQYRLKQKKDKASRELIELVNHTPYKRLVDAASRPEECDDHLFSHVWEQVNAHLGTRASSFPELVEQLGMMRFGQRPRLADTFCGSGQIPFEAARLGCDVYASDLNPVACMLTWGAFNIVGGSEESRRQLAIDQKELVGKVQAEIDALGVETDGNGWRAKVFLYCVEARCPQSGWMVPLIPSLIISKSRKAIARLVPDTKNKRYDIEIITVDNDAELDIAKQGTVRTEGKGKETYLVHSVNEIEYRTKISTLRGDYRKEDGTNASYLRMWEKIDFKPRSDDIFQERLYCIQWIRPKQKGKGYDDEFRSITLEDLGRETIVEDFVAKYIADWQQNGWIPDMKIESGYNTDQPIRERGWTHWNHLFNPRQLFLGAVYRKYLSAHNSIAFNKFMDYNAKLCMWDAKPDIGRVGKTIHVFYNQALNTLYNYATRGSVWVSDFFDISYKQYPIQTDTQVFSKVAQDFNISTDIYVTDPPYGDAVKYEEILEFFIAWLRKNPPPEFADWVWDSRRSLAIKGEDENFRRNMVAAYKRMTECMPDNGMQVIMFTHQSGTIWADMANIVWASGLQVTAAWYVVTETDSALREGSHVKGTILLICRKRLGQHKTTRDDLAWEIQEEVELQVKELTGLNQLVKGKHRDALLFENVFEDADIQMAGYAASLRVLTHYAIIDGRDMTAEAIRPRIKGEITFVDGLINFAVDTANQALVPQSLTKIHWDKLSGGERFYLKMIEMEARGFKTLDNYQNFAKAFKVKAFQIFMADQKANKARLKSAIEFGRAEMGEGSELHQSVLRAVLYGIMELAKNVDSDEVLAHLRLNIPNFYGDETQRELAVELADYLSKQLVSIRPEEHSAARVLCEMIKNQRLG